MRDSVIKFQELLTDSIYISDKAGKTNEGLLLALQKSKISAFETSPYHVNLKCNFGTKDVLQHLCSQFDVAGDYCLSIKSEIQDKSKHVFRDSSYSAEIYFAVTDTTRNTELFIEGRKHRAEGKILYYKEKANKSVLKTGYWILWIDPCGDTIKTDFTIEYEVVK